MAPPPSQPPAATQRKRRPVEVVVCPDIPAPGAAARARGGPPSGKGGRGPPQDGREERAAERVEFKRMWKSVMDLGAQQLTGYEKKMYDARRIVELGGKAPKAEKTPLKILQGKRAKRDHRDAKREQEIRESGLVVARKRPTAASLHAEGQAAAGGGSAKRHKHLSSGDIGASPYPVVGKMRGGTLFLNRDTINSVERANRKGRGGGRGRGRGGKRR